MCNELVSCWDVLDAEGDGAEMWQPAHCVQSEYQHIVTVMTRIKNSDMLLQYELLLQSGVSFIYLFI